ncbi:conserved hypothetical protein [Desulfamplus magnetovallimortis]|uniref:CBS domain-containing protein n=1 Tax=Desulfamplus magnetovallimortis TaxID=1246637 RepID=A0A1W1H7S4_9BACT|nr:CBS domain-containing protein [Desulfamplus magnetovallimortis]SLM28522.1 conserved hypothetical protein [Desulfamplus magnetovallimortis]
MNNIVKDSMVPISEYPTISEGATLMEAVFALENAKTNTICSNKSVETTDDTKMGNCKTSAFKGKEPVDNNPHWILLIVNSEGKVIGKLSQLNILTALETKNEGMKNIEQIRKFGFSSKYITRLREDAYLKNTSIDKIYADPEIMGMKVEDFMKEVADNDFIDENTSLATAAYQMASRKRLSMLVTREEEVVGVLRLSDVFTLVINNVKAQK